MSWNELLQMGNYPKKENKLTFQTESVIKFDSKKFEESIAKAKKLLETKNIKAVKKLNKPEPKNFFDELFKFCKDYITIRTGYEDIDLYENYYSYILKIKFKHNNKECGYEQLLERPDHYLSIETYYDYVKYELEKMLNQITVFKQAHPMEG